MPLEDGHRKTADRDLGHETSPSETKKCRLSGQFLCPIVVGEGYCHRMPASFYIRDLRARYGPGLLLVPAVAAVIRDEHDRLLLQRKPGKEGWSLPAGGIEPGESPDAALCREVLEETGRRVLRHRLLAAFGGADFRYTYPNGDRVEYTVLLFRCQVSDAQSGQLDPETVELRFVSRTDMPKLSLPYPLDALFS